MYLRQLELENTGPITALRYDLPFTKEGRPKPVIFVGQNGSGKSIVTSHIVNAMIDAKGAAYDDSDVEKGMVFKLRSPMYISRTGDYSRFKATFDDGLTQAELQLPETREQFEKIRQYTSTDPLWDQIPAKDTSVYYSNFSSNPNIESIITGTTLLYFPPNRFEEPAWLNQDNLKNYTNYTKRSGFRKISDRRIIQQTPLSQNQEWLLDIIYDSFAVNSRTTTLKTADGSSFNILLPPSGPATVLRLEIEKFLLMLLKKEGPLQFNVGARGRRSISLQMLNGDPLSPNLFTLSTGQTGLLNMFLTIMRDYDLSGKTIESLNDISGIVVIDEIDLHLHSDLQYSILPNLLRYFPSVQFILTSHSPLFILGMEKLFGKDGFGIVDLPSGQSIAAERFEEFAAAYGYFRETTAYEQEVRDAVLSSQRPILFVEGTIDIDYLNAAAEHLGRSNILAQYSLQDANGFGGLDKIYKHFDANIAKLMNQRATLVYDCDINKADAQKDGVRRVVVPQLKRRIEKGIENLFPDALISRARAANNAFIDVVPSFERLVRGSFVTTQEEWSVNPDEKRNLANWILANSVPEDFADFVSIFDLIGEP
ncbi:AAA family ATPase [Devosia sp. Leaf64]|uniref:AAA family ATPase n=1 Tax=Devosia sp. Leaf64 TaxID=1736229 RepID=UPI000715EE69|nr:AAA family ATPase [Devosia sp. Leaf64]KQN73592.1 hypothetical protein ASE94_04850 [Devosia sp. Leaf64]